MAHGDEFDFDAGVGHGGSSSSEGGGGERRGGKLGMLAALLAAPLQLKLIVLGCVLGVVVLVYATRSSSGTATNGSSYGTLGIPGTGGVGVADPTSTDSSSAGSSSSGSSGSTGSGVPPLPVDRGGPHPLPPVATGGKSSHPVTSAASYVTVGQWTRQNTPWNSTLSGIAGHEHMSLARLEALNPGITNPNLIHPGEKVRIH